jgi:hypothetical protein
MPAEARNFAAVARETRRELRGLLPASGAALGLLGPFLGVLPMVSSLLLPPWAASTASGHDGQSLGRRPPDGLLPGPQRLLFDQDAQSMMPGCLPCHIARSGTVVRSTHKSVYEALDHAGISLQTRVLVRKIESEDVEREGTDRMLSGVDGVLVPGGFGSRGIPGKIQAIRYTRERGVPFFGICLGLQCAVIEFARNVLGLEDANTTESSATAATRWCAGSTSSTTSPTSAARCAWGRNRAS